MPLLLLLLQVLDPENRGYIDEHTMHELLTENAWALRDKVCNSTQPSSPTR